MIRSKGCCTIVDQFQSDCMYGISEATVLCIFNVC